MYLLYLLYRPVLFYSGHAVQYEAGQSRSVYAMATSTYSGAMLFIAFDVDSAIAENNKRAKTITTSKTIITTHTKSKTRFIHFLLPRV
jgi:hypothetical protein